MRIRKAFRSAAVLAVAMMVTLIALPLTAAMAASNTADAVYDNPLIQPYTYTPLQVEDNPGIRNVINILLMGFDADYKTYAENGGDSHSDAMIVVSVNTQTEAVDLITLPRDTMIYVPGIRGMYKLNGAVNAGGGKTTEAGLLKACEAASTLLGNVPIDYYFAVEMERVVDIVDLLGGVDIEVASSFTTQDGTTYATGYKHLDGEAVYSYMRARKTLEGTDTSRTKRQRAVIAALIQKVQQNNLYFRLPEILATMQEGYYTNISTAAMLQLISAAFRADTADMELYTLQGTLRPALNGWNIHFIDQDARIQLLNDLFGINAEPLPYCSDDYCEWLVGNGSAGDGSLSAIRYLYVADQVLDYAAGANDPMGNITAARAAALEAEAQVKALFCQTADVVTTLEGKYTASTAAMDLNQQLLSAMQALKDAANALADVSGFPGDTGLAAVGNGDMRWAYRIRWETDPGINEVYVNFH
ncbi:MAG: LCP family protein [Eubacteriales bacterium]|nr:LCP family protein [Eubacteriales bacterium]